MVNGVLTVLQNINFSYLENIAVSKYKNHFKIQDYGKLDFLYTKPFLCNILSSLNKLYIYVYQCVSKVAVSLDI